MFAVCVKCGKTLAPFDIKRKFAQWPKINTNLTFNAMSTLLRQAKFHRQDSEKDKDYLAQLLQDDMLVHIEIIVAPASTVMKRRRHSGSKLQLSLCFKREFWASHIAAKPVKTNVYRRTETFGD